MKRLKFVAVFAAIFMGIGIYFFLSMLNKPVEVPRTEVVVAAVDILENTTITESMLVKKEIATEALLSNVVKNPEEAIGKVLSSDVLAGEQLVFDRLIEVGTEESASSLSYLVQPGMRAMTIAVSTTTGVGGMIKPGNRVDVLYVYAKGTATEEANNVAKVLLQNIPVLAVDTTMKKEGMPADQGLYTTVTLQVTPEDATALTYAVNTGIVSVALRSSVDTEEWNDTDVTQQVIEAY